MAGTFCEWRKRHVPGLPSLALSAFPALQTVSPMDNSTHLVYSKWHCACGITVIMNADCCCFRPEKIEIGKVMSLMQVKQKIPPALFSWNLYTGSHEGFTTKISLSALIIFTSAIGHPAL